MTTSARVLAPQPLTRQAFAPYGKLLDRPAHPATIHRDDIDYWHAETMLDELAAPAVASFLIARARDMKLTQIERHNHSAEAFVPLEGESVLVVAPPGDLNLDAAAAFTLDGSCAVLLHPGTWHWAPFPREATASFILLLGRDTVPGDIEIVDIPELLLSRVSDSPV